MNDTAELDPSMRPSEVPTSLIRFHVINGVTAALVVIFLLILAGVYATVPYACGLGVFGHVTELNCEVGFLMRYRVLFAMAVLVPVALFLVAVWVMRELRLRQIVRNFEEGVARAAGPAVNQKQLGGEAP